MVTEFSFWSITGSVEPPPVIFQVGHLEITPMQSHAGDTVFVGATVNNLLDEEAEYVAVLWVNSGLNSSQTLRLGAKESAVVSFELHPGPGIYKVQIDRLAGRFEVLVVDESESGGFSWLIILWIALGLTAGTFFLLAARRRRKRQTVVTAFKVPG